MGSSFDEKIADLEKEVDKFSKETGVSTTCGNATLIVGGVTPFAIAILFYVVKPRFVLKKEGEKSVIDAKKVAQWTLLLSLIVWVGLYLYSYYGGSMGSLLCFAKKT